MTDKKLTANEDLQFAPPVDGSPVQVALLWGDPETGPASVMVKFPEGCRERISACCVDGFVSVPPPVAAWPNGRACTGRSIRSAPPSTVRCTSTSTATWAPTRSASALGRQVPQPRQHAVRYHGLDANRARRLGQNRWGPIGS